MIDLENHADTAAALSQLVRLAKSGAIRLRIVAISASEKQQSVPIENFTQFQERLSEVGLGGCEILSPMGYLPLCFVGHVLCMDENALENGIHKILFPHIEFDYASYCHSKGINITSDLIDAKWANKKCDVQCYWSHCYHGGGVFVTSDENFHKSSKKSRLEQLGNSRISRPADALALLESMSN